MLQSIADVFESDVGVVEYARAPDPPELAGVLDV
jgi:hypothetical protein